MATRTGTLHPKARKVIGMLSPGIVANFERQRLDLILIVCVVFIWGLSWPVMKLSVAVIPPIWFTVLRYLIGALVLTAVLVAFGRFRIPHRRDLPIVLSVGLLQMLVFTALAATALQILSTGRAVVLAYTMPLWAIPIALLLGAQVGRRQAVAGAFGLTGILVLVDIGGVFSAGFESLVPCALLLTAALAWAVCMVHVRHHRWIGTTLDLAPWQMALATAGLVPVAFAFEGAPRISWMLEAWDSLLFIGVLATAFCSWAVVDVGTRTGPGLVSIALLGVPAVGLVVSLLVGQETPTLAVVAGSAAILFSISVVASEVLKT